MFSLRRPNLVKGDDLTAETTRAAFPVVDPYVHEAPRKITDEERETLGWETYGRLMRVREKGRLSALEKLFSASEAKSGAAKVECSVVGCGQLHRPFCAENTQGTSSRSMRSCFPCNGYHIPGCGAGTRAVPTVKQRMQAQWDAVDWAKILEEEFGASVKE